MARPPAVARVLQRVTATVREHEMFVSGEAVLVAVSGGPDSTCLLYSLHALRRLFKIKLEVFHLDHRLRPDSPKDAAYVARLAERLKLRFHLRSVEDGSTPRKGESIEHWGRAMRIYYASQVRRETAAMHIAEGHTLDDQAETLLIALVRGGGLEALGGIRPSLGYEVQPLIDVTREEVEAFCRALHLRPRDDPTNRDTRLLRNGIRLRGIPALERATGRELKRSLARTAELLRQDERELSRIAFRAGEELVEDTPEGVRLEAADLLTLSPAIASRVVRRAIYATKVLPTLEAVGAVLDLADGRPGRRRDLPNGLKARRERGYVLLSRAAHSPDAAVEVLND